MKSIQKCIKNVKINKRGLTNNPICAIIKKKQEVINMNEKQIVLEDLKIRLDYAEEKVKELEDELNSWENEKYSIIEQIEKLNE